MGEARIALEQPLVSTAFDRPVQAPGAITRRMAISALAGAAAGAGVTFLGINRGPGATARAAIRFAVALPEGHTLTSSHLRRVAIASDGGSVAFNVVRPNGSNQILQRALAGSLELRPPGDGVTSGSPFYSPDNRWLGYLVTSDGQRLRKVALSGGAPVTICNYQDSQPAGATWAAPDTIYFVSSIPGGISRVSPAGGDPVEVVTVDFDNGERMHKFPHALPGGDTLVYTLATGDSESFDDTLIAAYSIKTRQRKVLVEGGTSPCYSPSGHLVYARNGMLLAVPFDAQRLEITGQPFTALEGVMMSRNTGVANFDISATGDLIYVPGKADGGARRVVWVDRNGNAEKLPLPSQSYLRPRLSPDGGKLAIEVEGSNHDIHIYDFATGVMSKVTTDGVSHWPVWSPDGVRIGYRAGQMGQFRLWHVPADRSAPARQIPAAGPWQSVEAFSPDGKMVLYATSRSPLTPKLELTSIDGTAAPQPLDEGKFAQGSAKFSPDGRWLAYCSNESGRPQVYVQSFPGPGPKVQVSNEGGTDPVWRRTGGELFYRNGDRMMVAGVSTEPTFSASRPRELWTGPYSHGMSSSCGAPGVTSSNYDVSPDGQRFLMIQDDDQSAPSASQAIFVQGWAEELTQRGRRV
jgi:WD40 repeat protein